MTVSENDLIHIGLVIGVAVVAYALIWLFCRRGGREFLGHLLAIVSAVGLSVLAVLTLEAATLGIIRFGSASGWIYGLATLFALFTKQVDLDRASALMGEWIGRRFP